MPNTKKQIKKSWKYVFQARFKSRLGCAYTSSGGKNSGKKQEICWLELVHKDKQKKKKLAGSNLCSQIHHAPEKGDCIHACWSVILDKRTEIDRWLHVILNSAYVTSVTRPFSDF